MALFCVLSMVHVRGHIVLMFVLHLQLQGALIVLLHNNVLPMKLKEDLAVDHDVVMEG